MNALSKLTRFAAFTAACTMTVFMFLSVNTLASFEPTAQVTAHATAASANV